jgi:predicted DNA-binding WGR domain protein
MSSKMITRDSFEYVDALSNKFYVLEVWEDTASGSYDVYAHWGRRPWSKARGQWRRLWSGLTRVDALDKVIGIGRTKVTRGYERVYYTSFTEAGTTVHPASMRPDVEPAEIFGF